uniref:G-protein coupled receptors family 1 profile domain-containing protein n=1 Tax=Anopheles farauti TaxID=69004 RepID=A0A182Q563_9DIPT
MSESVELELLINCTQATVLRFPWSTDFNTTVIGELNRTEVLDVLGEMITRSHGYVPQTGELLTLREFITECLFPTAKSPYELPWQLKTAWGVVFGAMLLVAITGNCIVLWIVLAHRRMRTVTNYFLLNLSVADLLMSSLNCSFNFIFMLNSDWPFGSVYCTINNFMANMSVASSVFTLVAISFDRIVYTLQLAGPVNGAIVVHHRDRLNGHVGRQEVGQIVHPGAGRPVERIAHRLPVRIETIADATVRRGIVARPDQILHDPVLLVVRHHDEQIRRQALGQSLRYEHVRWPSAPAEIKFGLLGRVSFRSVLIQIAERPLERNRHGGLLRPSSNPDSYRANTLPRGTKSMPRDRSTSDCCQKVWNVLGGPSSGCTVMPVSEIPSKVSWDRVYGVSLFLCSWKMSSMYECQR